MKLLIQRYLAAQFILPMVLTTLFFIIFMMTFELFKFTELIATRDISLWFLLGLFGNIALTFLPMALPISILISSLYCMNRVCGDSEYIAMRAAGLTKTRLYLPFLIVSFFMTITVYQLNQVIIPRSNYDFKKKINYLTSSGLLAGIKEGQFFTMIPNVTLFADKATQYGRNLENVFLHLNQSQEKKTIFAQRGELIFERSAETLNEKLTLKLYNGNITSIDKKDDLEKILFKEYIFPITQNQLNDRVSLKETMLSSKELAEVLKMSPEEAEKLYRFDKRDLFNARYEFLNRKNGAFICLVFCLIGFSLGISGNRGKKKNSALLAISMLVIYYVLFFGLVTFVKKGQIPAFVGVFTPSVVLTLIGLKLFKGLDWQN